MHLEEFSRYPRRIVGGCFPTPLRKICASQILDHETRGMGENVFKKIETTLVSQGCLGMVA